MRSYPRPVGPTARSLFTLLTAAVMLLLCVSASADGAIGHLSGGGTVGYVPVRSPFAPQIAPMDVAFGNLDYSGGPVMPSNTNYTIYWSPGGLTDYPSPTSLSYADGIDQFFADIAHDSTLPQTSGGAGRQNVESVATQYNDADGNIAAYDSHFGGRIVDTAAYPSSGCAGATICLTKAQMETEIARVVHDNHLPDDLTHQYFLITPPGVESCFDDVGSACSASSTVNPYYCAFHGNIGTSNPIIYSIDNWVVRNPGCDSAPHLNGSSDGVIAGGMSHEHNEAITDPIPNSAWTDYGGVGPIWENGDKCNGESVVQVINHHTYIYQPEWSNFTGQCLARLPLAPIPVSASFTTVRTSPTTADFTATSDAGAGAKYVWQFNDYPPPDTPQNYTVETDSPQITHEFPAAGTYTVALTVMRSDGMSRGAANDVTLGTAPTAAFTAPANAVAGSDLAFDASGSTSVNNGLGAYRWEWGDGTADASGATPMHRFRSGGTFQVRLTVTDGIGLTNSTTRDVAVADAPTGLAVQSVRPVYGRHAVRITTVVNTSGPGAVTLVATTRRGRHGVVRCTRAARAAGAATMVISCTLGTDARDAIRRGRLPVRVATTFTPDAGTAQTMSRVVTLTRHP